MARAATRCRTSARSATCLYKEGVRTPSRSASSPIVSSRKPASSASAAAAATTSWLLSPVLGTHAPGEEAGHERGDLVGALRVRVVPGAVDGLDRPEPGRQVRRDRLALGPGIGEV